MENKIYINHLDIRNKAEEIRLKDIDDMTKEDAEIAINLLLSYSTYFPCGYSHTLRALEILKGDNHEKDKN